MDKRESILLQMDEEGPGVTKWSEDIPAIGADAVITSVVAREAVTDGLRQHFQLLKAPKALGTKLKGAAATLSPSVRQVDPRTFEVQVDARATGGGVAADALYVTLTTRAPGRFSENAFHILGGVGKKTLYFYAWGPVSADELEASLRVEDMLGNLN